MRSLLTAISIATALLWPPSDSVVAQQHLSPERAVVDVRFFFRTLEETHPDPYTAFGGKVEFKRRVRELLASIPAEGLDVSEVHDLLVGFLADLRDGHTGLSEPNAPDERPQPKLLPLRFTVATDAVFVSQGAFGLEGLVGTRLVAADGVPIERLTALAGRMFPTENRFGRARNLAGAIRTTRYSTALFGRQLDTLQLLLERPDGTEVTRHIAYVDRSALPGVEWSGGSRIDLEEGEGPIWWRYLDANRAGYLRLASIEGAEAFREARHRTDLPGYVQRYYSRYLGVDMPEDLDSALAGIPCFTKTAADVLDTVRAAGGEYLIVDVRSNGGGWSSLMEPLYLFAFGTEYLEYPFPDLWVDVASPQLMEMNSWTRQDLALEWGPDYDVGDYRFEVEGPPSGGRTLAEFSEGLREYGCSLAESFARLAGEPLYRPTVIVLVDSGTFSAAYHLAYRLWRMGAVLVGVPPSQAGNAYTNVVQIELPNSGLTGSIARSAQILFPDDEALGRVLEPEFPVNWSDFARYDFDPNSTLLFALDLIAEGRITRRAVRLP